MAGKNKKGLRTLEVLAALGNVAAKEQLAHQRARAAERDRGRAKRRRVHVDGKLRKKNAAERFSESKRCLRAILTQLAAEGWSKAEERYKSFYEPLEMELLPQDLAIMDREWDKARAAYWASQPTRPRMRRKKLFRPGCKKL